MRKYSMERVGLNFVMAVAGVAASAPAQATDDCGSGDCPAGYDTSVSVFCDGWCELIGADYIQCNMDPGTSKAGVTVYSAFDYGASGGTNDYSIWGTDHNGAKFACYFDDSSKVMNTLDIIGTELADSIRLNDGGGSTTWFVEPPSSSSTFTAYITGGDGNDTMLEGSYYNSSTKYQDQIDGGVGNDTIYARFGNDVVWGGTGNDTIDAGSGDDIVRGGAGNDTIYGGSENDSINGGAGDDRIEGNNGVDNVCGGGSTNSKGDNLIGGAGNDLLYQDAGSSWIATGSDSGGTNTCGNEAKWGHAWLTSGSCIADATSGAACPTP